MLHPIYRVSSFLVLDAYQLRLTFDDGATRVIDFGPVLKGEIYGPLRAPELFRQVTIDPEAQTLVWPNGADFDPAILHNWDEVFEDLCEMARGWENLPCRDAAMTNVAPCDWPVNRYR